MSEKDVITKTKTPLTKSQLIDNFKRMGIASEDTLLVHSSLSNLGYVVGGAQTVIEALLEVVDKGTIVMPAHTGDNSNPEDFENPPLPHKSWNKIYKENIPAFNKETSIPRGMGKIALNFLMLKDTLRSNHPVVSFSAYGKDAEYITADQPLSPMFGLDSPIGRIYRSGGKILMLGTDFSSCSSLHLSEYLTKKLPTTLEETAVKKDGERHWIKYEDYEYDEDDFDIIGNRLKENHFVKTYKIGFGEAQIMDLKKAVDTAKSLIIKVRNL